MNCPECKTEVPIENINIQSNSADCVRCKASFNVSDEMNREKDDFDVNDKPLGAWFDTAHGQIRVGAFLRSWYLLISIAFFAIWGIMVYRVVDLNQLFTEEDFFEFDSLFSIVYVLVGVVALLQFVYSLLGKVEVVFDINGGYIFKGIGPIGRKKHFRWSDINRVTLEAETHRGRGIPLNGPPESIHLIGSLDLKLGNNLTKKPRHYMYRVIKQIVADQKYNKLKF